MIYMNLSKTRYKVHAHLYNKLIAFE